MRHILLLCSALSFICATTTAQVWQSLNGGLKYSPVAMTEIDKTVAVAYKIADKGANGVQYGISIWNGSVWVHLPSFVCDSGARVSSMKWYKKELYIAGQFNRFNTLTNVKSLVKFSNRKYVNVPNISTSAVKYFETIVDLNIYKDLLVVAGQFASTEVKNSANLGFFDGEKWVESGIKELEAINGGVLTTLGSGDHFYVGGVFSKIGTTQSKYIGHFEKGELIPFTYNYARPYHMVEFNDGIIAAGTINSNETPSYFFKIEGDTAKKIMSGLDQVSYVSDLVAAGDIVYASGMFKFSTDQKVYHIVKFENGKWTPLNIGEIENVNHLLFHNDLLIAGGEFKSYRGITLNHIAALPKTKYAIVNGNVFHDKDNNCVFNGRDEKLNENLIRIQPGNRVIRPKFDGSYQIYLEEGKYTITVSPGKYWGPSPCASLTQTVEVDPGDVLERIDFPLLQQSNVKDLSVVLTSTSGPRAVARNTQQYFINYSNLGSSELVKGDVKLVFDSRLENFVASPKPEKVIGDTAYWSLEDLSPGERGAIKCLFKVKDTATNLLELTATIAQPESENDDNNNSSSLTQKIMEEDVEIHKFINPGTNWTDTVVINQETESIQYQISFANYTDDTVRSVYVIDTVSLINNILEIKDVAWSHPVIPITIEGPKYSDYLILIYKFENIDLPPNPTKNGEIVNDEGHITFELMLSNLNVGMEFFNRAKVVFEYDYSQMTNEVLAFVDDKSSVQTQYTQQEVSVYPNPTDNMVSLDIDGFNTDNTYKVISMTGQQVLSGSITTDKTIDLSSLTPSVYFINVTTEDAFYTAKVIKQ